MVFIPEPTTYKLNFKETDLAGLEVEMTACSVEEYSMLLRVSGQKMTGPEASKANDEILDMFIDHLIKWNLGGKDKKIVPRTRASISKLENRLVTRLIAAWQVAMITVDIPLQIASPNGELSEEASLGLGNASESPQR